MKNEARRRVAVVGAGISGLSAAYELSMVDEPLELIVLDSSSEAGGVIRTVVDDGRFIEQGPESFVTCNSAVIELAQRLGISGRLVSNNPSARHSYIAHEGNLHELPESFFMFSPNRLNSLLFSGLLSPIGKLRILLDLIIPMREEHFDESIASFIRRRLGSEALRRLADPLIAGIYGADPEKISAQSVFASFVEFEEQHGSIIKGLWQKNALSTRMQTEALAEPKYGVLATFDSGLKVLIEALLSALPEDSVQLGSKVYSIVPGSSGRRYDMVCKGHKIISADAVILAMPTKHAATILKDLNKPLSCVLNKIEYRSVGMFNFVFHRKELQHIPAGFGFLVPNSERKMLRALSISSHKFSRRVPPDQILLRAFVEDEQVSSQRTIDKLLQELNVYFGMRNDPLLIMGTHYKDALPKYQVGHRESVAAIRNLLTELPGISLAGNAYEGISISDCIQNGKRAGQQAREFLKMTTTHQ